MLIWKIKNFLTSNQGLATQSLSSFLFLGWLLNDRTAEPFVAFLISIVATFVSWREADSNWRNSILGELYEIHFRGAENNTEKVPGYILGQAFCVKWKIHHHDGEFKTMFVDVLDGIDIEKIQAVTHDCQCKLYRVKVDNKIQWECEP